MIARNNVMEIKQESVPHVSEAQASPGRMAKWAIVAGAGLLCLSACKTFLIEEAPEWQGPEGAETVGIVGDSQVHAAETGGGTDPNDPDQFLTDLLVEDGYSVSIAATNGVTSDGLQGFVWKGLVQPDVRGVALGANDVLILNNETGETAVPIQRSEANIRNYLDTTGTGCVVLVEVPENALGRGDNARLWNEVLADIAEDYNGVVMQWDDITKAHPEYLTEDQLHQTALGQEAYREFFSAHISTC